MCWGARAKGLAFLGFKFPSYEGWAVPQLSTENRTSWSGSKVPPSLGTL